MSDILPNEEGIGGLDKLPVPDQDQSWQKMEKLLDKEDDTIRIPPFLLQGCSGWGILLLSLAVILFFIIRPDQIIFEDKGGDNLFSTPSSADVKNKKQLVRKSGEEKEIEKKYSSTTPDDKSFDQTTTSNTDGRITEIKEKNTSLKEQRKKVDNKVKIDHVVSQKSEVPASTDSVSSNVKREKKDSDKSEIIITRKPTENDSLHKSIFLDTVSVISPVDSIVQVKKTSRKIVFSGGIGVQQQIPLHGQKPVPYDYFGRKASVADYIPSLFLKMHWENKWFVMGEFRFGAPQVLNELPYSQRSSYDNSSHVKSTTTTRLKKTYYHQFPFTVNYNLVPAFSIGSGIMYSRFAGAVYEEEIKQLNILTQDETVSRRIMNVKGYSDSFFYRSQLHLLLQADYNWKKLGFGFRFSKDLQPYIKFTKPDGAIHEEKNYSLQAIIRYQLFRTR